MGSSRNVAGNLRRLILFKRKNVFCTNCGFFCWLIQHESGEGPSRFGEISSRYRQGFQAANPAYEDVGIYPDGEEHQIYCLRRQWFLAPHREDRPEYVDADDIRKTRQCPYYIGYQPAFGPEEHKELKREAESNRNIRNAALFGAAIGAGAAIIVQLLYVFFVSSF